MKTLRSTAARLLADGWKPRAKGVCVHNGSICPSSVGLAIELPADCDLRRETHLMLAWVMRNVRDGVRQAADVRGHYDCHELLFFVTIGGFSDEDLL